METKKVNWWVLIKYAYDIFSYIYKNKEDIIEAIKSKETLKKIK